VCLTLQVVAFQAMMEVMAEKFPGAFSGYTLKVCGVHAQPANCSFNCRRMCGAGHAAAYDVPQALWASFAGGAST
jgi:hypothetical protein